MITSQYVYTKVACKISNKLTDDIFVWVGVKYTYSGCASFIVHAIVRGLNGEIKRKRIGRMNRWSNG